MSAPLQAECAAALDRHDVLAGMRARFALPVAPDGSALIYLCGHSLGLAPRTARAAVLAELEAWERLGVEGHTHGARPWIDFVEPLRAPLAALCGAEPLEVVAMNSLSVNLHLLLAAFYRPTGTRNRILIEAGAFSSDRHVVHSQIRWHGLDPEALLVELAPREGEEGLRPQDIESCIAAEGQRLALVLWPGVQYRTGQVFELARIARAAGAVGARTGFDLAHAIGNVPLALHASTADFAAWCSYKYLNGGPGAIGGAFVHARHGAALALTRLQGWWGHTAQSRFQMSDAFIPGAGAAGWQISNPPILSAAPLHASLALFAEAGIERLREKSCQLSHYLADCLQAACGQEIQMLTPTAPAERGAQLSIRVRGGVVRARAAFSALTARGVVADWREPDVIRLAPVPLYNRFEEARGAALALGAALRATA